ncbi:uncharacterized protein [Anabrus simplex]|uniref:uncharacterized protein n=1 Tax=Anabrus simplex TaxID=316456 RepID=UPI0035A29790
MLTKENYRALLILLLLQVVTSFNGHDTLEPHVTRWRRQADRNQIINNIFQIPIQTLTAINSLAQSTRPIFPNRFNRESIIPNIFSRPPGVPAPPGRPATPVSRPVAAPPRPPSRGPSSVAAAAVQVPIATLTAVGQLMQSLAPGGIRQRVGRSVPN